MNEDEKNLEKNYDQKEYSKEDDVNFKTRIERNYENKNYDIDKHTMKIITEAVMQSIIMKKGQMMAVKITIKADM